MGGKYSAEWWEKIASIERENSSRHEPSNLVNEVVQATANAQACSRLCTARVPTSAVPRVNRVNLIFDRLWLATLRAIAPRDAFQRQEGPAKPSAALLNSLELG
jgi:hypothetical protein